MEQERMLLAAAVFFPMAAGIVSYLIGRKHKKLRDQFVGLAAMLELILTVAVAARLGTGGGTCTITGTICFS